MRRQKPDLVGMSFLSTTSYPYAKMLARQLRAADADVKLAFGGVFATLNAPLVKAQCPEVDFVCRGDGEQLIVDLLERLDDPDAVTGVTWQEKDGTLRNNPNRTPPRDLDQWPFPDRESLPLDFVESMPLDVPAVLSLDRFTTMQTSRGCPWPCVFCDIPIFNEGKWRSRSAAARGRGVRAAAKDGYGAVYFVDDHFLLQPKRIEAICEGLIDNEESDRVGLRGACRFGGATFVSRAWRKAACRTLMFGIESGSQKILDRLKKEQTLDGDRDGGYQREDAPASRSSTASSSSASQTRPRRICEPRSDFASKLPLDTFGFNRLCVYRGTPLWQEYVRRGLVNDALDWYKYFKCSSIDPTCLPGEEVHRIRSEEMRKLIIYKFTRFPIQTFRLLRRFVRFMPFRDVIYLVVKPFLGKKAGATNAEVVSRAVEHAEAKSAAADLTSLSDEALERAIAGSKAERARIQAMAEAGD